MGTCQAESVQPSSKTSGLQCGGERSGQPPRQRSQVPSTLFFALIPSLLLTIWLVLLATGYGLDSQSKLFDVLLKIVTISATIIGAIWSYYAFFRQRLTEPRLNVVHEISPLRAWHEITA